MTGSRVRPILLVGCVLSFYCAGPFCSCRLKQNRARVASHRNFMCARVSGVSCCVLFAKDENHVLVGSGSRIPEHQMPLLSEYCPLLFSFPRNVHEGLVRGGVWASPIRCICMLVLKRGIGCLRVPLVLNCPTLPFLSKHALLCLQRRADNR